METHKVGVIGSGTIGLGLAVDLAAHAYNVTVVDNNPSIVAGFREKVVSELRMYRMLVASYRDFEDDEILQRIVVTGDLNAFADADFIIENITENLAAKLSLFDRLATICRRDAC